MRLLIVTAVTAEKEAVARGLPADGRLTARLLTGGVGPVAAAARTATALAAPDHPCDLVLSAGIGGGFAPLAPIGSTVVAAATVAADLGVQVPAEPPEPEPGAAPGFRSVAELGFGADRHLPPPELATAAAQALDAVHAPVLTVATATGTEARAAELRDRHPDAAAEAMEGFGVAEAAALHGVPVLELRTVSNTVGRRDRAAWRIPQALTALTEAVARLAPVLQRWWDGRAPGVPTTGAATSPVGDPAHRAVEGAPEP